MIIYQNKNVPPFSSLFPVSDHKDLLFLVTIAVGRFPELSLSLFYGTSEMERNIPASKGYLLPPTQRKSQIENRGPPLLKRFPFFTAH